jgi:hypothetical protein
LVDVVVVDVVLVVVVDVVLVDVVVVDVVALIAAVADAVSAQRHSLCAVSGFQSACIEQDSFSFSDASVPCCCLWKWIDFHFHFERFLRPHVLWELQHP